MDPPQPLTPETLWACATGPLSFFLPTLPRQPPELCSDYAPPGVLPLLFPLKFCLSFNACPTLCPIPARQISVFFPLGNSACLLWVFWLLGPVL